jgi:ABC-2 type transport system ATP-binding protein
LIEARALVKHYDDLKAVDGVNLSIAAGTCVALLGPNGAGKTTTVEMLEGIKAPTSGRVLYQGGDLGHRFRNESGIMFQSTAVQEFITVRETLKLFAKLYPRTVPMASLIERCNLDGFLDRDTRRLSGGQRQRLLLAIALVNDPVVVFLDEPTTGLDPQARRNFWALVHDIKGQGKTVILTTHYMDEAYELSDQIVIMDHGKVIARGTPQELLAEHFDDVILQIPEDDLPAAELDLGVPMLAHRGAVEFYTKDVNATIQQLIGRGVSLHHLQVRPRTLEDLFIELTGHDLRP